MKVEGELKNKISEISDKWIEEDPSGQNERKTSRIIFDKIHGAIQIEDFLVDILDRPPMQRLRWIKQLGASEMLYPNGTHSRFEHSLGTYCIAQKMLMYLEKIDSNLIKPIDENNVLAAALLHDVGHLCLSHTGELFLEYCSNLSEKAQELKQDISIHEFLGYEILGCKYFKNLIDSVNNQYRVGLDIEIIRNIIIGQSRNFEKQFLADIVHGPIDADRVDYLLRDAHNVGFPHIIDIHRFINTITILKNPDKDNENYRLGINEKGIRAVESLFIARNRLRPALYEHHVSRIGEEILIRIMKECLDDPLSIMELDDYDLFCTLNSCEDYTRKLGEYKNRKFFKRLLFFQCISETLRDTVRYTSLDKRLEIEKEISSEIFGEKDCCMMIVPKTKEKINIGEVFVLQNDGKVKKASYVLKRMYSKYKKTDTERTFEGFYDFDQICETYDIRLFSPWKKTYDINDKNIEEIKTILSEMYKTEPDKFEEMYRAKPYYGFSI